MNFSHEPVNETTHAFIQTTSSTIVLEEVVFVYIVIVNTTGYILHGNEPKSNLKYDLEYYSTTIILYLGTL